MSALDSQLRSAFQGEVDWPSFAVQGLQFKAMPGGHAAWVNLLLPGYHEDGELKARAIGFVPLNIEKPASGRLVMVELDGKTFESLRERQIGQRLRKVLRAMGDCEAPCLQGALHLAWLPLYEGKKLVAIEFATLRYAASGKASEDILFRHKLELIEGQPSRTPLSRLEGFSKALLAHQDQRGLDRGSDLDPSFLELRKASSGVNATLTPGTTEFLRATLAALFDVQSLNDAFFQELNLRFREDLLLPLLKQGKAAKLPTEEIRGLGLNLLMRLLFLRFLEAKGWILNDEHWMLRQDLNGVKDAYADVLAPVFESLAMPKEQRRKGLPDLPYLNGGLFDPDTLGLGGLTFDPNCFKTFRTFLYQHAFTLEESTPLDQRVAIDPEMLGRVFETLVLVMEEAESKGADLEEALEKGIPVKGKTRRKVTGSYYTPRVIVQYLCRETLDAHLMQATGRPKTFFEDLRAKALDAAHEEPKHLRPAEIKAIEDALARLRVCDPAVGSGAFLVGMMQEILLLRTGLARVRGVHVDGTGTQAAEWKREAITQCLYGLDLNPEAVEICRLRLWLSLVIDAEGDEPLPSLDFRIVCGDSLVDRLGGQAFPDSIGGDATHDRTVFSEYIETAHREAEITKTLKATFAKEEDPAKRRDLRRDIMNHSQKALTAELRATQVDLLSAEQTLKGNLLWATRGKKQFQKALERVQSQQAWVQKCLGQLEKDGYLKKPFFWKLTFPEVFDDGGFDIVVGNPPYVRQENQDGLDQETYLDAFPMVACIADLLTYFMERGHQILKAKGHLGYITSNKYMRSAYGANLRSKFPSAFAIRQVIDFGDLPVFEVAAYPALFIAQKEGDARPATVADLNTPIRRRIQEGEGRQTTLVTVREALDDLPGFIQRDGVHAFDPKFFKPEGWVLEAPEVLDLLAKLLKLPGAKPLGDFAAGRMYYGIKTGLNEAFVIDEATKRELIRQDKASKDLIKPWLRGKDVKRWKPAWAGKYVIAIQNSGDADCDQPWSDLNPSQEKAAEAKFKLAYPAVWAHMKRNEAKLRPRADQGKFWWELRACAYYEAFSKPKIVWPSINRTIRFAWEADGTYVNDKCNMIVGHPEWLLGILNSELLTFIYCMLTSQIRGSFMELKTSYISPVPIVEPSKSDQGELISLVRSLGTADPNATGVLESHLDDLVYRIYGLSAEERALIEAWFLRRSLNGGAEEDEGEDDDEAEEA